MITTGSIYLTKLQNVIASISTAILCHTLAIYQMYNVCSVGEGV